MNVYLEAARKYRDCLAGKEDRDLNWHYCGFPCEEQLFIRFQPMRSVIWVALGCAYMAGKDLENAEDAMKTALDCSINPDDRVQIEALKIYFGVHEK